MARKPVEIGQTFGVQIPNIDDNFIELYDGVSSGLPYQYGIWSYAIDTIPPADVGQIRLNNLDPLLATEMYVSNNSNTGADLGTILNTLLGSGDAFYVQQTQDAGAFFSGNITSDPVDNGSDTTIGVNITEKGTALVNGEQYVLLSTPSAASYTLNRVSTEEFNQAAPVDAFVYDLGIKPSDFESNIDLTFAILYTSGGDTWASFNRAAASTFMVVPDVWISGTSEPGAGGGDVSVYMRYNSVADTLEAFYDFDGGGKTALNLQVVSAYSQVVKA